MADMDYSASDPRYDTGKASGFGPWGAMASFGYNLISGLEANRSRFNAQYEQEQRRLAGNETVLGQGRAAEGASGVVVGASSMATHLATLSEAFRQQHEWAMEQYQKARDMADQKVAIDSMSSLMQGMASFGG